MNVMNFQQVQNLRKKLLMVSFHSNISLVQYQQLGREDTKKFFYRSVSVKEGDVFSIQKKKGVDNSFLYPSSDPKEMENSFMQKSSQKGKHKNVEYMGCFEEDSVDQCEIRYSSFISLQIMGIMHIGNIDHLKCIPSIYLYEEQYLVQVLKTILENAENHALEVDKLIKEFRKWVRRDLSTFYELYNTFGDINTQLFQRFPEYFGVSPDIKAVISVKDPKYRSGKYPITFPKEYFEKESKAPLSIASITTQSISKADETDPIIIDDGPEAMDTK